MTTHRFAINVPNPRDHAETVELTLEPVPGGLEETALPLHDGSLHVERAGISLDPCDSEGARTLELKLNPFASAIVTVMVVTAPNAKGGTTAFNLVDRRGKRVVGGVTLACVDRPLSDGQPRTISSTNPCPIVLAASPYPVGVNANPSIKPPLASITLGTPCDLVAPLTNPTKTALEDVQAYLEHLGTSDAQFTPTTWNIGTLAPGDVFYATWRLQPNGGNTGTFQSSIVVASKGKDAIRLRAPISVTPRGKPRV
jgi:hypothetical protein